MTMSAVKSVRLMLGAAGGVACLLLGDGTSVTAPANARAGHPPSASGAAHRAHRRAVVLSGTIPFNFGYSAGGGAFYGYAPGTYGGVGCYHSTQSGLVCP